MKQRVQRRHQLIIMVVIIVFKFLIYKLLLHSSWIHETSIRIRNYFEEPVDEMTTTAPQELGQGLIRLLGVDKMVKRNVSQGLIHLR